MGAKAVESIGLTKVKSMVIMSGIILNIKKLTAAPTISAALVTSTTTVSGLVYSLQR